MQTVLLAFWLFSSWGRRKPALCVWCHMSRAAHLISTRNLKKKKKKEIPPVISRNGQKEEA